MQKFYGAETKRAIANFPISGLQMSSDFIRSLALIKEHAAVVNGQLGEVPKGMARKIAAAARSIKKGNHLDQFPVDVFQTGSGTSSNMNVNEVIVGIIDGEVSKIPRRQSSKTPRNLKSQISNLKSLVHPNDHVNRCQSSNDVVPSAIQISCALAARDRLLPALGLLAAACEKKGEEFHGIIKTGRTHLMDAVPVRLGDEFRAYASLLLQAADAVENAIESLCVLPLGGTAVGTGLNAHPKFAGKVIAAIAKETGLPFAEVEDHIAAQSCPLTFKSFAASLGTLACALLKISGDIRLMGSGPAAGFAELILPELQKGSSIMPGKVNPVLCESVEQVCFRVQGMEVTVGNAVASASRFELHTAYPLIASELFTGIDLLSNVMEVFATKCVRGIRANTKKIKADLERNAMMVTALGKEIGYDKAAEIAKEATRLRQSGYGGQVRDDILIEVAMRKTGIAKKRLERIMSVEKMV